MPDSSAPIPVTPVTLYPGRARLTMNPLATGSPAGAMTIGIVLVAFFEACTAGEGMATMTSTLRRASSIAKASTRSRWPSATRHSIAMFRPST